MCNPSIPSLPPHPFLLPFFYLILLFFSSSSGFSFLLIFLFSCPFFTFPSIFFFIDLSVSLLFQVSTSDIKEVFVSSTETTCSVFSAPALCFCSRKKPGEHITETLAHSVSNVKLCRGRGQILSVKYIYSTCATVCLHYST